MEPQAQELVWDPTGTPPNAGLITASQAKQQHDYAKYLKHPGFWQKDIIFLTLFFVALYVAEIFFLHVGATPIVFFTIIIVGIIHQKARSTEEGIAYLSIAEQFNWLYQPVDLSIREDALAAALPEIFKVGDGPYGFSNQCWGKVPGSTTSFWTCKFHYYVSEGKSKHEVLEQVYAFQMEKPSPLNFSLTPHSRLDNLANVVTHQTLTVESNEFNQAFHIAYDGRANDAEGVYQVLNPNTMSILLDLYKTRGPFSLVFRGQTLALSFPTHDAKMQYTNFIRKPEVDQRDIDAIVGKLTEVLTFGKQLVTSLD